MPQNENWISIDPPRLVSFPIGITTMLILWSSLGFIIAFEEYPSRSRNPVIKFDIPEMASQFF